MLDDTYDTLYPGGIFNNGFALGWAKDRVADARPATRAGEGQGWARKRIADGDETCRTNQELRLQSADVQQAIRDNAYRRGAASDALAPESFVHDIDVPCSSPARGRTRKRAATSPTCSATSRPTSR